LSDAVAQRGTDLKGAVTRVETVHPNPGGLERIVDVPGTVRAFDHANLYARVAGFLKVQYVDIGDHVIEGQILAELDVPDLVEDHQRRVADLLLARAKVEQSRAAIQSAIAETNVATTMIRQAEAEVGRATSARIFREKQYIRFKELVGANAIDKRLGDEKEDERDAAISAEQTANARVATAKSQVVAWEAKVVQARADLDEANAKVDVAKAQVQKAAVMLDFAKIVSPYDGVITQRSFHVGDFIQSADQGGGTLVLQVQKIDVMRLEAQIPDRDVAYVDVGDTVDFKVDGLSGTEIQGHVSRFSHSEDERTRSMRTEIDLPNPDGKLRDGMYGKVRFHLDPANPKTVNVPSACLTGTEKLSHAKVFVCLDGKLKLTPVTVGFDNGSFIEVIEGVTVESQVVFKPDGDLVDGSEAEPKLRKKKKSAP